MLAALFGLVLVLILFVVVAFNIAEWMFGIGPYVRTGS